MAKRISCGVLVVCEDRVLLGHATRSPFTLPNGAVLPEFDRFGLFAWDEALGKVGKNLARVLNAVRDSLPQC